MGLCTKLAPAGRLSEGSSAALSLTLCCPPCSALVAQAMPARLQGLGQPLLTEAAAEAVAEGSRERAARKRVTPDFRHQFAWCLSRAVLMKTRQPLLVFTDHAIFALTGGSSLACACEVVPPAGEAVCSTFLSRMTRSEQQGTS